MPIRTGTRWILASASPRRKEILRGLGMRFTVDPCTLPEPARRPGELPSHYAIRAAREKARAVAARHGAGFVIGADTIVVCGDDVLGKPAGRKEGQRMLERLNGRWHEVITGLCLYDLDLKRSRAGFCTTRVHFRRLTAREIRWYLDTGEYTDKAGAYAVQGYGALFIDRIEGCYFNVVGFPVATFERLCLKLGFELIPRLSGGIVSAHEGTLPPDRLVRLVIATLGVGIGISVGVAIDTEWKQIRTWGDDGWVEC